MSPFSIFFARLVGLLGAEIATQVVREFAGKTIQFPITDHYGDVKRIVTKRLTIFVNGIEYDVSRLPQAAVGDAISVNPASLAPLDTDRFAFGSQPPHANSRAAEMNQTAPDLQAQSPSRAQPSLGRLGEEANARLHASEPEAVVNQALSGAQASQPTPETQSEGRSIDPANVDRS